MTSRFATWSMIGTSDSARFRRSISRRGDRDPAHAVAGTEGQRLCRTVHPDGPDRVPRSGAPSGRTASSIGVGDVRRALQLRTTPSRARPCCAGGKQRRLATNDRRLGQTSGPLGWPYSRVLPNSRVNHCDRGTHQPRSSHRRYSKWGSVAPPEGSVRSAYSGVAPLTTAVTILARTQNTDSEVAPYRPNSPTCTLCKLMQHDRQFRLTTMHRESP
jgi:hypothetical protein